MLLISYLGLPLLYFEADMSQSHFFALRYELATFKTVDQYSTNSAIVLFYWGFFKKFYSALVYFMKSSHY